MCLNLLDHVIGKWLRENGHNKWGIRLDSGDLAHLSKEIRGLLDAEGFTRENVKIVASNDLNEHIIDDLRHKQDAKIDVFGVGTHLLTSQSQPALGGVYKVTAIEEDGVMIDRIKIANAEKTTTPGVHQVRRYFTETVSASGERVRRMMADVVYDIHTAVQDLMRIQTDPTCVVDLRGEVNIVFEDLLKPVYIGGVFQPDASEDIHQCKARAKQNLCQLDERTKRFSSPQTYTIGLEESLYNRRLQAIRAATAKPPRSSSPVTVGLFSSVPAATTGAAAISSAEISTEKVTHSSV